mmetsp:Transcript_54071/g.105802  ORF Transcript_54071/g.105802 Transcript_54071/m.105802 type:complete len:382 (+) Transcript_54071:167-1312(+)
MRSLLCVLLASAVLFALCEGIGDLSRSLFRRGDDDEDDRDSCTGLGCRTQRLMDDIVGDGPDLDPLGILSSDQEKLEERVVFLEKGMDALMKRLFELEAWAKTAQATLGGAQTAPPPQDPMGVPAPPPDFDTAPTGAAISPELTQTPPAPEGPVAQSAATLATQSVDEGGDCTGCREGPPGPRGPQGPPGPPGVCSCDGGATAVPSSSTSTGAGGPLEIPPGGCSVGIVGGSQSFSLSDPYTTLNYIIALEGIYPSRNRLLQEDGKETGERRSLSISDPTIGQVALFAGNFAPRGWALCEGQLLPISSNSALFSILGTTYGGDGRTTFGLPDLRGRAVLGNGGSAGLGTETTQMGQKGGQTTATLTTLNIPSHNHECTVGV